MKNPIKTISMRLIFILMIIMITTCTTYGSNYGSNSTAFGPQTTNEEALWRLLSATDAVNANLSKIVMFQVDASLALSKTGIDGPAARSILSNLTNEDAAVIDCVTIDPNGTVHEVQPASFESVKGVNLLWQEHINDTINTKHYSGFYFINAVEGIQAIDSEMPIFSENGTFLGTVSLMLNNSQFFGRVLAPYQPGGNSKIWMSKADDGTVLYETDLSQMLLNKSSSMYLDYPELLKIFDRMSLERTGYATYEFLDESHGNTIKKGCYWTTISNDGTEMRIVLTIEL